MLPSAFMEKVSLEALACFRFILCPVHLIPAAYEWNLESTPKLGAHITKMPAPAADEGKGSGRPAPCLLSVSESETDPRLLHGPCMHIWLPAVCLCFVLPPAPQRPFLCELTDGWLESWH